MTDSNKKLLDVKNLRVTFKQKNGVVQAIDGIDFDIEEGEVVALLGDSGSGKSMTALSIMRLLPPAAEIALESKIKFNGRDILKISEIDMQALRGRQIAIVFQEPMTALNPVLTIGDQIAEVVKRTLVKNETLFQKVVYWLNEVGISEPERRYYEYPHQLSGGMRQRVVIAIAIAAQPDLLIADEPTSALDVSTQEQILTLLRHLQNKFGMAMLFITHDKPVAVRLASRFLSMRHGKIIDSGSIDTLKKSLETIVPVFSVNTSEENPLMSIRDFCVYFPVQKGVFKRTVGWVKAVEKVNLDLYPGRTLALVGESGSGKSTLAKGILQLIPVHQGDIYFEKKDLTQLTPQEKHKMRQDVQIIFQDPFSSLNPRLMVLDIVAEGLVAHGLVKTEKAKKERVQTLLNQVGLEENILYRYPHEFSGGQRQRISIARALAVNPKIIICDEPTTALDAASEKQIIGLLKRLQEELGLTYLFITHNIPLAERIADRIAVMKEGRIVEQGATEKIMQHPEHTYTKLLLSVASNSH